ncbi:MAG: TonB-dependent receptor [Litorimonas sp.]
MNYLSKTRLLQSSVLSSVLLGAAFSANAQDADPLLDDEVIEITETEESSSSGGDEIVVTGSRLRRSEFSSASPLQVIDGEVARDLGLVDASDILGQTTVVQGQQITTGLSTSAGNLSESGPGSATASLRGLNPGRTLVLVNGRRLAPAGVRGAPSAPDLNLIPGALIERVDVLLDGASAVYGSDAVAGVVNYELKKEFEGIQLDAFATLPEGLRQNAGHQEVFSATAGVSNDKGYITLAVEHSRTEGYAESALADFYSPYGGGCRSAVTLGASGTIYNPDLCTGSFGAGAISGSPFGFLSYQDGARVDGLPDDFVRIGITGTLIQPDDLDGQRLLLFPEELNAAFAPDFNRTSLFATGEYDTGLPGDMTLYFEASHAQRETRTDTSGQGAIPLLDSYVFSPFQGSGAQPTLFYNNRFQNDTNVAQTRLIGGLKGDLPFLEGIGLDNWGYDAYWSYSRSSGQDSVSGVPFFPRLEATLANTRLDATTGEAVCDSRGIPGVGQTIECRPLNFLDPTFIFTGRFDDPEDNAYLFPNRLTDTIVKQSVISGYVSGDLFDIPTGGTVIVGFGGELREDEIETRTSLAGDFQGFFNDPGSNGKRDFEEFFGEIEIPLVKDKPFIDDLTLNLAGRYTNESNFGSAETYSVKGQYSPTDFLSFAATFGTSFRAPNLQEQFGGSVTGFANPADPCRTPGITVPFTDFDNDPNTPDTRNYDPALENRAQIVLDNCLNGGGPFGIPATNPFNLGIRGLGGTNPVFFGSPTRVASGSNPELRPETSEALSLGATFDQPWIEDIDLKFAVNYFKITIEDEVNSLTAATIVNRCYNSVGLTDPTCEFLVRDPLDPNDDTTGEISFVSALNQNLGDQVVEGIDYNAEFGFDFELPGLEDEFDYRLIGRATQSLEQTIEQFTVDGTDINDQLNEYGNPEWRLTLTNTLSWKDFSFLWQSRFIDSQIEDNVEANRNEVVTTFFSNCSRAEGAASGGAATNCTQFDDLASYWNHTASLSFARDSYVVRVGVNNVFNTAPPLTTNNDLGNLGGIGYDIGGRTFFMNATKTF